MHDGFLESIYVENIVGLGLLAGKNRRKLEGFLGEGFLWLVGGSPGDERLAGSTPLILLIFSTEFSMSSSWLKPLNEATTSNSPGIRWASTRFGNDFSFWSTVRNLPLTLTSA